MVTFLLESQKELFTPSTETVAVLSIGGMSGFKMAHLARSPRGRPGTRRPHPLATVHGFTLKDETEMVPNRGPKLKLLPQFAAGA
jgi:hypothetical protein